MGGTADAKTSVMNDFTTIDQAALLDVQGGLLHGLGEATGFGAGVAVTAGLGLGLVPGMNAQVPGQPAGFEKRHEPIIGPKITSLASGLSQGPLKTFATGLGEGATAAPGWSFRHGL